MTQPPLLLPGTAVPASQWRAQTLQLVNWGGFHGHNEIEFAPTATLISGASGTGKSTLLDAYLALMMPSDTPFNGASNDAITGRARSVDQRNLISYLRGKTDDSREAGTGELREHLLRGADGATWGAIGMTFLADSGQRFTALRMYYVPRGATRAAELTMKLATHKGYLNLADLTDLVASKFDKRSAQARFPNMTMHDTYSRFAQTLYTRLGIGANGDGSKALRLLARIQAGHQIRTVDDLYKSMVLELPATYAAADRAVEHFTDLEAAYEAMLTEAEKEKVLSRLPDLTADLTQAQQAAALIDTFGLTRDGDTPFLLWRNQTEDALLTVAEEDNQTARTAATQERSESAAEEARLDGLLSEIRARQDAAGGSVIKHLDEEIARRQVDRDQAEATRTAFDRATEVLALTLTSSSDLAGAQTQAREFLNTFESRQAATASRRNELLVEQWPLSQEQKELRDERTSLEGRAGRVPKILHDTRLAIAEASGIDPSDLPFVAELIDVDPHEVKWRKAVEVTLRPVAMVLLVDATRLEQLSEAIDPLRLPTRITFEGVPLAEHEDMRGDARFVSGKLMFKPSPFSRWVQQRVTRDGTDALCVDSPQQLGAGGRRVSINGQTRSGKSGSHGELGGSGIIGFSNVERLAEIDARLEELEQLLNRVAQAAADVERQLSHLHALKAAHERVLDVTYAAIDVATIERDIESLTAQRQRILDTNDVLATLNVEEQQTGDALSEARRRKYAADALLEQLGAAWATITDRQDIVRTWLDRVEREQSVSLTPEQLGHLDAEFSKVADTTDLGRLEEGVRRLRQHLAERSRAERDRVHRLTEQIVAIFATYQGKWPDPNLGTGIESLDDYRDILDNIVSTGLHERRQEWSRRLAEWSGQDLVPLAGAFSSAVEEIEERLRPVNDILAKLPFGAHRRHLKIDLRHLSKDDITKFRRELRLLSSGTTQDLPDDEIENRFKRLRKFIALIKAPEPGSRATSGRDYYLDVRKHVEITAVAIDDDGVERSTYAALGGKSGGETQELVAFIVGAALRFQLGDEANTHPTFSPVFLDEGFVKSDSEFAGRAVSAWKGLGFQLIIGAPLDKVTALEPHVDKVLSITKSSRGYSHVTELTPVVES